MKASRFMFVLATSIAVSGVLISPHVSADPKDDRKEARKEAKEDRKEAKEARKDLRDLRNDGGTKEQVKDAKLQLKEAEKRLKETRHDRRTAATAALKAKYGGDDFLKKPAVHAELKLHARRMAKLHHMKRLADGAEKKNLEERIDKLIEKEQARHQTRMDVLKANKGEDK